VAFGNIQQNAQDAVDRANATIIVRSVNTFRALNGTTVIPFGTGTGATINAAISNLQITQPYALDLSVTGLSNTDVTNALRFINAASDTGTLTLLDTPSGGS
jgi:hypothetical protein